MSIAPTISTIAKRVRGQSITKVFRRAKRVVLELSSGEAFVVEPRMTGLMLISDPPDEGHLRVAWQLADEREPHEVFFWDRRGLGTIRLLKPDELALLMSCEVLGRDALEMELGDWQSFCRQSTTPIKVALLNQKKVAGIGNLYASEILHLAGISPLSRACDVTPQEIELLTEATQTVLQLAIRYEGSTLSDGTYRNALNQAGGYQNAHRVYDREHEECVTCHQAQIVRIVQAQRSTFYCPHCQSIRRTKKSRKLRP